MSHKMERGRDRCLSPLLLQAILPLQTESVGHGQKVEKCPVAYAALHHANARFGARRNSIRVFFMAQALLQASSQSHLQRHLPKFLQSPRAKLHLQSLVAPVAPACIMCDEDCIDCGPNAFDRASIACINAMRPRQQGRARKCFEECCIA